MRNTKRYTMQSFTKRVDHEGGSHRGAKNMSEPAVCKRCGIVRVDRHWTRRSAFTGSGKHDSWRPAKETVCPACFQIENGIAGGYLTVEGLFFLDHRAEIENLITNEAEREREANPLARVMSKEIVDGRLEIQTTNENLAERFGRALEGAYSGRLSFDFSHENKVARIYWSRDQ